MPNDAMILTVDKIRFTWPKRKKMRLYAVGIAADNLGGVFVTEPPSSSRILHRPKIGKPAVWDFGGDGYPVYQRTAGLADIIIAHLLIVRDRGGFRRVGEIVKTVAQSDAAKSAIKAASDGLSGVSASGLASTTAMGLVLPVVELVGDIVSKKKDTVLQTLSGSLFLSPERKEEDEFANTIVSPDNNMEVEADAFLFDAAADTETEADTKDAETRLKADGLLFTESDVQ